jgi:hypothetical protein
MTGMKIWQIKTRKADQADFEMAEIQHNRREPVLGEVIDVAVKRKGGSRQDRKGTRAAARASRHLLR